MTCKTPFDDEKWAEITADLAKRPCTSCLKPALEGGDAVLPFDTSYISLWTCRDCHEEIAFVVSPSGEVYRL